MEILEGASPPKKQTQAEKRKYYQVYDKTKHVRAYKKSWEEGRSWLYDTQEGMKCAVCVEFDSNKTLFMV